MESGTKLARYTIASLIGQEGMCGVCQAKEEMRGRQVAMQLLAEEFAEDTDSRDSSAKGNYLRL